jgi:hypothetical protein
MLALCAAMARTAAGQCTKGFYTLEPDEHAPACLFHATYHDGCPRENEATDLVYVTLEGADVQASNGDEYLQNGTGAPIELSASDCASQFRTRLYLSSQPDDTTPRQNATLNNDPEHAPYSASYPYILLDDAFIQGATLTLSKVEFSVSAHTYYQITHIEPLVAQKAQPHGIREADQLDHTLCYAGFGSAGGLFLLLIIVIALRCRGHSAYGKYSMA